MCHRSDDGHDREKEGMGGITGELTLASDHFCVLLSSLFFPMVFVRVCPWVSFVFAFVRDVFEIVFLGLYLLMPFVFCD